MSKCTPINPCKNGGTCTLIDSGDRQCNCQRGYSGQVCEHDSCKGILCGDHGQCKVDDEDPTKSTCQCDRGYSGDKCQIDSCEKVTCSGQGTCEVDQSDATKYTCLCKNAFAGDDCEITCMRTPIAKCQNVAFDLPCYKVPSHWPDGYTKYKIDNTMATYYPPTSDEPEYIPKKLDSDKKVSFSEFQKSHKQNVSFTDVVIAPHSTSCWELGIPKRARNSTTKNPVWTWPTRVKLTPI